jgi:hypothetical protein
MQGGHPYSCYNARGHLDSLYTSLGERPADLVKIHESRGIFEEVLDGSGFVFLFASRYDSSLLPSYFGERITMKITQILT